MSATYTGSFTVGITISPGCDVRYDVCTWRTAAGSGTDYTIDPSTIQFTGSCIVLDTMNTVALFNLIAQASIARGYTLGQISCPAICADTHTSRVYQASCILRTGSGANTTFNPCVPVTYCARVYRICCPNGPGNPMITYVNTEGAVCAGDGTCLPTCP